MLDRLNRIQQLILRIENGIMALLLGAMILLAAGQILLRNLFDSGLIWADPALRLLVLWITMFGAIAASREHRHIRIDLFSRFLKGRPKQVILSLTDLFTALVSGVIAWHATRFVYLEWQDANLLFGALPAWLGEIIIPIGFSVLTLRFLSNIPLRLVTQDKT